MTLVLTGADLGRRDVVRVARDGEQASIHSSALRRMEATRATVDRLLEQGVDVYGLTTGVGAGKGRRVRPSEGSAHSSAILRAHLVAQGPPLPVEQVRAAMLVLVNGFAGAWPGVRPELALHVLDALNRGRVPVVRSLGSVGQADLAPLAELADAVLGDLQLAPGEGLAMLSSNAFATGGAALALSAVETLLDGLDASGALALEAFGANLSALHPAVGASRPSAGLRRSLDRLRLLLDGSRLWDPDRPRELQDPLTFRSIPQVHGALYDGFAFAERQLAVELNASQGNPIIVVEEDRAISTANFDSLPLASALDVVRIALAPALAGSSERSVKLLDASWSGLPRGLALDPSSDGMSFLGIAVQAIAVEARLLASPVSFEMVSTAHAEGIEDRTAMAPLAVRRTLEMVELAARIVAIELVVASQALELRGATQIGEGVDAVRRLVRERVAFMRSDESRPPDVGPVTELVRSGALSGRP